MAIIETKPTSPGRRFLVKVVSPELHKGEPYAPLTVNKSKTTGRNHAGRITVWQKGGGHKRRYRMIDWKRDKDHIPAVVKRIEYDPNRSAHIALLAYSDGEYRYIIAPKGLQSGETLLSGQEASIVIGNTLPLRNIPLGTVVHCIELKPGKGAQLARSAGCWAELLARESGYAVLRLKSGEMRKVFVECKATIGEVGNSEHNLRKIGKAGRNRWLNKRPRVRGVAMNPVDHPLGGGEGRTSGGRPACSPWGIPEGKKTRRNKRTTAMILRRRKRTEKG